MWFMILWGKGITSVAETWGQCNGRIKGRELFEKERGSLYPNIMSSSWADVLSEKRRTRSERKHSFHVRPQNIKIMNRVGFFIIWNPNLEMTLQYLPERVLAQNLGASVLGAFYTEGGYLWPSLWLELGWNMQPNKQTNKHTQKAKANKLCIGQVRSTLFEYFPPPIYSSFPFIKVSSDVTLLWGNVYTSASSDPSPYKEQ